MSLGRPSALRPSDAPRPSDAHHPCVPLTPISPASLRRPASFRRILSSRSELQGELALTTAGLDDCCPTATAAVLLCSRGSNNPSSRGSTVPTRLHLYFLSANLTISLAQDMVRFEGGCRMWQTAATSSLGYSLGQLGFLRKGTEQLLYIFNGGINTTYFGNVSLVSGANLDFAPTHIDLQSSSELIISLLRRFHLD